MKTTKIQQNHDKRKRFSARVKDKMWTLYQVHGPRWTAILNDLVEEQRTGKISAKGRIPADERTIKAYIEERIKRENAVKPESSANDLALKHDAEIFRKSDAILDEKTLVWHISSLQGRYRYYLSSFRKIFQFREFCIYESNQFVDNELNIKFNAFSEYLIKLNSYCITNFIKEDKEGNDTVFLLWPREVQAQFGNCIEDMPEELPSKLSTKLQQCRLYLYDLAEEVKTAYLEYRRLVIRKLYM